MQRGSQIEQVDVEIGYQLEDMICDLGQEYFMLQQLRHIHASSLQQLVFISPHVHIIIQR